MKNARMKLILAGAYILTFIAALAATCFIQNFGVTGGSADAEWSRLPELYISYDGSVLNRMDAYVQEIDCGYLRESVSVMEDTGQMHIGINANGHTVLDIRYRITDAANTYTVEEGALSPAADGSGLYVLALNTPLVSGKEYCLTLILTDDGTQQYYYYTRILYGEDYRLSDKLQFVWDFNQNTMDPDMSAVIKNYLETSGLNDNTSFTNIDIYSSADAVMWGGLTPSVTGSISTNIKAMSVDAATIQLLYKVQIYEDAQNYKQYYVNEYYTIQLDNDVWHLKDFHRSMNEIPGSTFDVSQGMLRLGVVPEASLGWLSETTDTGDAAVFVQDGRLWYYDVPNNMMTCVFDMDSTQTDRYSGDYPYGIKALDIDADGTLYFIVYGYMTGGVHSGENGIAVYVYDLEQNTLQEQAFIPSDRGYEVLKMDVDKLAFMNDEHQLYLCLNDIVYRIDYVSGQAREVIEQLDINNYKLSADGTILAMPNAPEPENATQIQVYYLDSSDTKTISESGKVVRLLGFFRNDIVYGTADPSLVYVDSVGSQIVPMDKIYIADRQLNVVREYAAEGKYIMDVRMESATLNITLATQTVQDGKTVYQLEDGDYLVNNEAPDTSELTLTTVYDDTMRNELYMQLPSAVYEAPLGRSAIIRDSGESVFEIEAPQDTAEKYYLYTGEGLFGDYTTLVDAVEACTQPTGLIVSESKAVVWQKSIRSEEYRIDFNSIAKGDIIPSVVQAICSYAEGNSAPSVDPDMTLIEALRVNLKEHTAVSLRGLSLEDVLYFVYSDRPVVAQLREGEFVIIVGYNDFYLQIADPTTGQISDWNYEVYKEIFEDEGNIFLSYY